MTIVQLKGKILFEAELETLYHEFHELNAIEGMNWIMDLTEMTHTNSTGIGFLVRSLTRSRINNGELVLCGVKGNVEKLFEIGITLDVAVGSRDYQKNIYIVIYFSDFVVWSEDKIFFKK